MDSAEPAAFAVSLGSRPRRSSEPRFQARRQSAKSARSVGVIDITAMLETYAGGGRGARPNLPRPRVRCLPDTVPLVETPRAPALGGSPRPRPPPPHRDPPT